MDTLSSEIQYALLQILSLLFKRSLFENAKILRLLTYVRNTTSLSLIQKYWYRYLILPNQFDGRFGACILYLFTDSSSKSEEDAILVVLQSSFRTDRWPNWILQTFLRYKTMAHDQAHRNGVKRHIDPNFRTVSYLTFLTQQPWTHSVVCARFLRLCVLACLSHKGIIQSLQSFNKCRL